MQKNEPDPENYAESKIAGRLIFHARKGALRVIPWEADLDTWQFTRVGPEAETLLGYPVARWYEPRFWVDHIHPADLEWTSQFCRNTSKTADNFEFEYRMTAADGRAVWLHDIVSVVQGPDGKKSLRGFMIDITERKQAEENVLKAYEELDRRVEARTKELSEINNLLQTEIKEHRLAKNALHENELRYTELFREAPDPIITLDPTGRIESVNSAAERISGYDESELKGRHFATTGVLKPSSLAMAVEEFEHTLAGDTMRVFELEMIHKNGTSFTVEANPRLIRQSGIPSSIQVIFRDVTQRKVSEDLLRKSKDLFQTLAKVSPVGIFRTDAEGQCIYVNERGSAIIGMSVFEALGEGWARNVHPEDRDRIKKMWYECVQQGKAFKAEYRFQRPGGDVAWVLGEVIPERDPGHKVIGYVGTITDITEQKQIEEKHKQLQLALEYAVDGISRLNTEGKYTFVNQAYANLMGYKDPSELIGKKWEVTVARSDRPRVGKAYEIMRQTGKGECEATAVRKDGSTFRKQVVMIRESGQAEGGGHYCFIKDVTETKYREALEMKSELITMISHELRTPLHSLGEGISVVLEGVTGDINPEQRDALSVAKASVKRLTRMLNNILDFEKIETVNERLHITEINLNELIVEVNNTVSPLAKSRNLALVSELDQDLPPVPCDRDKISQVLMNLMHNAVKFTKKGQITVRSSRERDYAKISISDTGVGIRKDDLKKIFRRFGQLKEAKRVDPAGTGLGLAISRKIVERHGGELSVESKFGAGASFSFTLPLSMPNHKV